MPFCGSLLTHQNHGISWRALITAKIWWGQRSSKHMSRNSADWNATQKCDQHGYSGGTSWTLGGVLAGYDVLKTFHEHFLTSFAWPFRIFKYFDLRTFTYANAIRCPYIYILVYQSIFVSAVIVFVIQLRKRFLKIVTVNSCQIPGFFFQPFPSPRPQGRPLRHVQLLRSGQFICQPAISLVWCCWCGWRLGWEQGLDDPWCLAVSGMKTTSRCSRCLCDVTTGRLWNYIRSDWLRADCRTGRHKWTWAPLDFGILSDLTWKDWCEIKGLANAATGVLTAVLSHSLPCLTPTEISLGLTSANARFLLYIDVYLSLGLRLPSQRVGSPQLFLYSLKIGQ